MVSRVYLLTIRFSCSSAITGDVARGVCIAKAIARDGSSYSLHDRGKCYWRIQHWGCSSNCYKTIVGSSLVKSAVFGNGDPNWGRIAAKRRTIEFDFNQRCLNIQLGEFIMTKDGTPQRYDLSS
jgi:glutamate N-acetyltransferase/amino-acid N-acetyltransferase